jgi:hypothetical protein
METFKIGIEQSLNTGAFLLVIVVDNPNEDMRHIITYINDCCTSGFSLHALEIHRFANGSVKILVRQLLRISTRPTVMKRRKKWDEDEFFKIFSEKNTNIEDQNADRELYDWLIDNTGS